MTKYPVKLNLEQLHKTTSGSHQIKVYDPIVRRQGTALKWFVFVGLLFVIVFIILLFGNRYYPQYTKSLLDLAPNQVKALFSDNQKVVNDEQGIEQIAVVQPSVPDNQDSNTFEQAEKISHPELKTIPIASNALSAKKPEVNEEKPLESTLPTNSLNVKKPEDNDNEEALGGTLATHTTLIAKKPEGEDKKEALGGTLPAEPANTLNAKKPEADDNEGTLGGALPANHLNAKKPEAGDDKEALGGTLPTNTLSAKKPEADDDEEALGGTLPANTLSVKKPEADDDEKALEGTLPTNTLSAKKPEAEEKEALSPKKPESNAMATLLQTCEIHLQSERLTTGKKGNAFDCYHQVLALEPNNIRAKQGLVQIEARYQQWAMNALKRGKWKTAQKYIKRLQKVNSKSSALPKLQRRLATLQRQSQSRNRTSKPPKPSRQPSKTSPPQKPPPKPKPPKPVKPSQCNEILAQESLGIMPLTSSQREFKQQHCH